MPAILRWLLRLGPTNPIAVRIVQGGSRRTRHLYIRTGYLALLITVLMWSLLVEASGGQLSYRALAAAGATSFAYTAYLQIILICVIAPVFMAGAIAQEANPRTWDILLTTPLSGAQIVLGNLFGRLFFILALLFASLPLFAVTQYFGGAPGRTIFASYAIAACAAVLVAAIAIMLSVSRLAGRRAVFSFYVAVISYLAVTWAIDLWMRPMYGGVTPLTAVNPFLALESLLSPASYPRPETIELVGRPALERLWMGSPALAWCIASGALSVLMMAASTLAVRHMGAVAQIDWRKKLRFGSSIERIRPARRVWQNPVAWREAASRRGTLPKVAARWSFIGAGALWGIGLVAFFHSGALGGDAFRFALLATVWAETAVIAFVAMNMAGSAVSREREDGTLDLLLITPITASQYVGGKLRGLISYLAPLLAVPVGTIALASLYVLAGGLGRPDGVLVNVPLGTGTVDVPVVLPVGAIVAPLTIVPFVAFCVMVGLQWSIKSKGTISAVIATLGIVSVVAGIMGLCGWKAGETIPLVGPALACLNPATALFSIVRPEYGVTETLQMGPEHVRGSLIVGSLIAAGVYAAIVYGMHASMVRTFDMTVRRLAGTK
ncbi:MAG: hypothetical protein EA376_09350 [Phycisphaeraceae bacterium]|nr:MAG: hypothetical protein EA376_09350 [Phycisphaeraceae bacterium]